MMPRTDAARRRLLRRHTRDWTAWRDEPAARAQVGHSRSDGGAAVRRRPAEIRRPRTERRRAD